MKHLAPADYIRQPWKNGKGVTVELARAEQDGALLWRLSMATVTEDGPFSLFPGIERNLTVLEGPGFRLVGDGIELPCLPLSPVAFPGDVAVQAIQTGGVQSVDFNVMTARHLPLPQVSVLTTAQNLPLADLTAVFALQPAVVNGQNLARHDLVLTQSACHIAPEGAVLAVRLSLA